MKRKISHLVGSISLCSILAINMLATPNISFAAQKSVPEGVVFLKNNTLYKYDLNGDDKVDEIKCKYTTSNEGMNTLKMYINNKLCLTKKSDIDCVFAKVCDIDKNDNYLDLFIYVAAPNDHTLDAFFTRYNGKALGSKVAFTPKNIFDKNINDSSYELNSLTHEGTFYIRNYTFCNAIGNFMCYRPFQLKDNAITAVPVSTYEFTKYYSKYKYKAAKSFPAYDRAGDRKIIAYTVKKGDKVTFDMLYISKSGKTYLRMTNTNGETGWIKSDQKNLFVNTIIAG